MNLADCYRLLEVRIGASTEEIKASYRRLARQYHPDVSPDGAAHKFIEITAAYKRLLSIEWVLVKRASTSTATSASIDQPPPSRTPQDRPGPETRPDFHTAPKSSPPEPELIQITPPPVADDSPKTAPPSPERALKQRSYQQLQQLLRERRFPRATTLVEGLAQRFPEDPEVRQWQAITYQQWGHALIELRQFEKARGYLKKALSTDPYNKSLWLAIEDDFRVMEKRRWSR
jgi:tetratricopeptide (TPR) repeat protein